MSIFGGDQERFDEIKKDNQRRIEADQRSSATYPMLRDGCSGGEIYELYVW